MSELDTTICRVDDIPRLGAREVTRTERRRHRRLPHRRRPGVRAARPCPHKGGPLSQGIVFGDSVACPLHNWTIGLVDGCAAAPDVGCAQRFSVRVEDGAVALDLAEITQPTTDIDAGAPSSDRPGNDAAGASVEAPAKAAA